MHELKFRQPIFDSKGKFLDWFYWGFYEDGSGLHFIAPLRHNVPNYQFTGLCDKNGKEIYEGDVSKRYYNEKYPEINGLIEWDNEEAQFEWHVSFLNGGGASCGLGFYLNGMLDKYPSGISQQDEVIGNIHENPELLE